MPLKQGKKQGKYFRQDGGTERTNAEGTLLHPPSKDESNRRSYIQTWLLNLGIPAHSIRAEYRTERSGIADIYLTNRRVFIEVKKEERLKNGPESKGTGSKPTETSFEQLDRYVRDERSREQRHLDDSDIKMDASWIGVVTDCRRWWLWRWRSVKHDGGGYDDAIPYLDWQGKKLNHDNINDLARILDRKPIGREWATADMSVEFVDVRNDLTNLYEKRKNLRATITQKGLWLEQLRGSGNAPETKDVDNMFVVHTMLILIARMISYFGDDQVNEKITEGFVQWVTLSDIPSLSAVIEKYDWHQHPGDVLRALYHYYIHEDHRKIYGEYYTPDWLADLVCQKVIDNMFIMQQIEAYYSKKQVLRVLDPACGSGTFLYHATRRIMESEPMVNSGMDGDEIAKFICNVVYGVDIHPVAVEMAKANMRRLFPKILDSDIHIYQGDSLLMPRPEASFYSVGGSYLPLQSPKGSHLIIPIWFVRSASDVSIFVNTAKNDRDLPDGLGSHIDGYDHDMLLEAHTQLRKIIREEDDGVWKWYILNQAGPMNMVNSVGRIISNPPWVRFNKIQVESRKDEIKQMAMERCLWTGGNVSTSFDIASLFVDRCMALYMNKGGKAGWIIPHGSINGRGWEKFREKLEAKISCKWNLRRLPFANTPTAAIFFGINMQSQDFIKNRGAKILPSDSWEFASTKINCNKLPQPFPTMMSEWVDGRKKPIARNGATIVPYCLTVVESERGLETKTDRVYVTTRRSMHNPWLSLGQLNGNIPVEWITDCISTSDLMSYLLPTTTRCILPLSKNNWDPDRYKNKFWKNAFDLYVANCGNGNNTPQTLESQLNFSNKLFKQFNRTGEYVVYNASGDILYASRIVNTNHMVTSGLFSVACTTQNEALFLISIMNASCMLPAFQMTRQSDRDFSAHIWRKIPIPRYDENNELHKLLARLGKQAEEVALREYNPNLSIQVMRNRIRTKLQNTDVGKNIDRICCKIMPNHAS